MCPWHRLWRGASLMEDILMLPPSNCAITSHDPMSTDRKGPPTSCWHFCQGRVFILHCLIYLIERVCPLIKKFTAVQLPLFKPFLEGILQHIPMESYAENCAFIMFWHKRNSVYNNNHWQKIWLIILIFLKPCLEDESIWCQGSSQTRNWATDWLLVHLTIW